MGPVRKSKIKKNLYELRFIKIYLYVYPLF